MSYLFLAALTPAFGQPIITRQPTNQSLSLGATAVFTVSATGTTALSYQWRLNGVDLDGETKNRLVLTNLHLAEAGEYTVVVSNPEGAVTSQPAILDVDPTFTKITTDPIVTDTGYDWHGQAWGDYDGDGDQDVLLMTDRARWNPLYRNNGDGSFTRVFEESLQVVRGNWWPFWMSRWGDYDNDGRLDLFIADASAFFGQSGKNLLFHNEGNGRFTRITDGPIATEGAISSDGVWADYDQDGDLDLFVANGGVPEVLAKNWLYQNQGDGSFLKLTNDLVQPLIGEPGSYDVPAWVDVDNDGRQDLFIAGWRRGGATNYLYRSLPDVGYLKVTDGPLVNEPGLWAGMAWADYDNDGDLDVFLTTGGPSDGPVALYQNDGAGNFIKMTANEVGPLLDEQVNAVACTWGDYDNDGWLDLYIPDGWHNESSRSDRLYRNNGDGTFSKVTRGSPVTEKGAGMSANWVDVNNDGFLDLFTAKHPGPDNSLNRLYLNNGNSNAWLSVKCEGTLSPRWGTGAKVRVKATVRSTPTWQLRLIDAGGYSWGGQSFVAYFGLGDATVVETLRIEWTSGIVQELKNVPVNQFLTVTEPSRVEMLHPGELQIQSWPDMSFEVESSLDLRKWVSIGTVTNLSSTGRVHWTEADAPASGSKFYRAVARPWEVP